MKVALALLLVAASASAETLPIANTLHVGDYARFSAIAAYRALDWKTTTTGIRLGCHEVVLPKSVANSPGGLAALEIGATAGQIGVSTLLIHRGHRKLAESVDYLTIGAGMLFVSWNEHAIHTQESFTSKLVEVGK